VEAQLEERFLFRVNAVLLYVQLFSYLLVDVKLAEDLSRIEEVSVVNDPSSF
jgi:hypothetical protein